jgi:hypothetical protein
MVGLYPQGRVVEGGTGRNDRVVLSIGKKYRCGNATRFWGESVDPSEQCHVPTQQGGLLLQVVYAIDQDDMLIGYSEFADHEEEQAKQEKRPVARLTNWTCPPWAENLRSLDCTNRERIGYGFRNRNR